MDENGSIATAARMAGCVEVSENRMYELECPGRKMKELNEGPSSCQWECDITSGKCNVADDIGFGPRQTHDYNFNKHDENVSSGKINVYIQKFLSIIVPFL